MTSRTRSLLLFIALAAAAVGTWMLARDPDPVVATRAEPAPPTRGFFLVNAELFGTGDDGQIRFTVRANRVEQAANGGELSFEEVRVEYVPEADINWSFSAASGTASEDLTELRLTNDIEVIYSGEDDGELRIFETDWLTINADESRVFTEAYVSMRKGSNIGSGTGLDANLKTGDYTCCAQGGAQNAR